MGKSEDWERVAEVQGFIAVDGTSLTVVDMFDDDECFNLMLVA